ncbi:LysR family transcriptional regulator [Oceanobacter kriegii]|uniref:LysR family transcriptional regulator n=1 Tax=Oceanobacter kriegii TaxID=64972 RepID=UPI0004108057|nr:LysR family transcriptional regulator [Oceanobacter kriegii]
MSQQKRHFNDLHTFIIVAREGSFTRAAAQLGVSQSALSHALRGLESQLGVRLLTRTTRSVSPTEAGQRLLSAIEGSFDDIERNLDGLSELKATPTGRIRITTAGHAAESILWPKVREFHRLYPDIQVEVITDYNRVDIVADRFDAGVRIGEQLEKDMVATRIGPDLRMAIAGSPGYFEQHGTPTQPEHLTEHRCINLRLPTMNNLLVWDLERQGQKVNLNVNSSLVFSDLKPIRQAAIEGLGLVYLPEDAIAEALDNGQLVRVLEEWCEPFPGYYLYSPSRETSHAFRLFVEFIRYQGA